MSSPVHCLVVSSQLSGDPRAAGLLADAHALGLTRITGLDCHDLYFIEGRLSDADRQRLSAELLSDPVTQIATWRDESTATVSILDHAKRPCVIETAFRPGVTDPVADQILRAAKVLGVDGVDAVMAASTGQRYVVRGRPKGVTENDLHTLARRLLANPVIQRYALGEIEPVFPHPAEASGRVEIIPLRELEPDEVLALSHHRRAALDLAEMQAIQNYFRAEGRDPTDVEFEMIAQTWSEHCAHKTFKAHIILSPLPSVRGGGGDAQAEISSLLNTYLRAATEKINAPWVRSAFVDNAGIMDFDDEYEISFKVETHNHPSAIEPFGGANTGVGGVIRDILGVSAKPIAATDVLCFGPQDLDPEALPEGVLHPRRIRSGVVAGIQDYGNKIGLPTVNGAILYDLAYTANPLVFCGCVGIAPKGRHPRQPYPGDRVIVLGGRTGRDGLRGATFSSMRMDAQTGEVAGASVQIGDPITEKGLIEVITRARDLGLYHAITDCGAGGLSSAVGEMARNCGADVELKYVRLKYPGLAPWEIWLSEAQERMVLAVPEVSLPQLRTLCDTFGVELTDIGVFTDSGRIVVRDDGKVVLELVNDFLYNGLPRRTLIAHTHHHKAHSTQHVHPVTPSPGHPANYNATLLKLLSHPTIASKADVIRVYDHEVQGGTIVKPLTGAMDDGPSDACVIKPLGTKGTRGIVLSNGINPEFGKHDPYLMALSAVDEAIRNAVAVGADPGRIALLDNFCWGDPTQPETLGALVEAARGCHDAALHYGTPFISGKDSLNNEYLGPDGQRHAIPPTLLISAVGIIEDVNKAVTMDLKEARNIIYLLSWLTTGELGGSHFNIVYSEPLSLRQLAQVRVPRLHRRAPTLYRALHAAMQSGLVRSCHDISQGGLAVAAAEMCIAGRLGMSLSLSVVDVVPVLFDETNSSFLVEIRPEDCAAFEALLAEMVKHTGSPSDDTPLTATQIGQTFSAVSPVWMEKIGAVTEKPRLVIMTRYAEILPLSVTDRQPEIHTAEPISLPVSNLVAAWQSSL